MNRFFKGLRGVALLLGAALLFAPRVTAQANIAGDYYASNFYNWNVPAGDRGPYSWSSPSQCVVSSGGVTFPAFQPGQKIQIIDSTPSLSETVTVTDFRTGQNGCSIVISPVHQHLSFVIRSASYGLQEAIRYAKGQRTVVHLTPEWYRAGATISLAHQVVGQFPVTILDETETSSELDLYAWNGVDYVPSASTNYVQPVSGTPLNKATGLTPNNMPEFQVVSSYRQFAEIGKQYFDDPLTPAGSNTSFFAGQDSSTDLGIIAYTQQGYKLTPQGGLQNWGMVFERKRLQTSFETGTATITQVPTYSGSGNVVVQVGLTQNNSNWFNATYNLNGNTLAIVTRSGGSTFTANTVSGSPNLTNVSGVSNLYVGRPISGAGIPGGTTIASLNPVVMSANATATQTGVAITTPTTTLTLGSAASPSALQAGDMLSLVVDGPYMYAMQSKPDGSIYRSGLVNMKPYFDARAISTLELFQWGFGEQAIGNTNSTTFRDFKVSYFGGLGLRDYDWVKYEDGTPYQEEGLFYFTATIAGWNDGTPDAPIQGAYMGTFTFDPVTYEIKQVGRVLFQDNLPGTQFVVGEHAGQLIFDRDYKYWIVSASSFGSFDMVGVLKPVASIQYDAPLVGTHIVNASVIDMTPGIGSSCAGYTNQFWDTYWTKVTNPTTHRKQWAIASTVQLASLSVPGLFFAPDGQPFNVSGGSCVVQTTGLSREGTKIVNTGNGTLSVVVGETNSNPNTVYTYSLFPFAQTGSLVTPLNLSLFGSPAAHYDMIGNYNKGVTEYFALLFGTDAYQSVAFSWGTTEVIRNAFGAELNGYGYDKVKVSGRPY